MINLPDAGPEFETLTGALDRIRSTFEWKCRGLDAVGTFATLGPGKITLGGLLRHLAFYEDVYFTWVVRGDDMPEPWRKVDFEVQDWDWDSAHEFTPEALLTTWQEAVARSREATAKAYADGGLDGLCARTAFWWGGQNRSLRRVIVDMNEEYARHTGHADLIRESVDGLVGEDAPPPPA